MIENGRVTDTDSVDLAVDSAANADSLGDGDSGRLSASVPSSALAHEHHPSGNFPGIGDYAFLSDCETNCLIAPSGGVEWMCVPRPDSPSVFTALLDRAGGSFRVAPFGVSVPAARRYLPGTLVLETTWQTPTGWLVVRDALILAPWHNTDQRSKTHRRSPTDYDAAHVLLRSIKCIYGNVDLQMSCEPIFDYARKGAKWTYPKSDYSEVVATAKGQPTLRLSSSLRIGIEGRTAMARTKMKRDELHYVALAFSDLPGPKDLAEAEDWMWRTGEYWRQWLSQGTFPDHPWRSYLQSSALALKGLSYAPTGALLAAATTSLPETPGGERNWDYRYTWIRDSTFALWGLYTLGFDREANDFFFFIHDVCRDNPNDLQIMYGVGGERHLDEGTLDHLSGYDDAIPVRIGNGAFNQQQHDVWGALLDSIYLHTRSREQMPEELWPIVIAQVEQAAAHWRAPDRGIWEVRGEPQHFTASKIMCWVAMDRGVRLARLHDSHAIADKWQHIADEIHADVLANGVDERAAGRLPDPGDRAGHRRRTEPRGSGASVPRRGNRRRAGRRGGHVHDLLFLAGLGVGGDRRARAGARALRAVALALVNPRPVRRRTRPDHRTAPGQLPAGLHSPGPDQRRHPRHPGGGEFPSARFRSGEPAGLSAWTSRAGNPAPG
jgi:GH15 family glucan-1,4-alpha-glucosidase